jgi:hypothetical protein
MKAMTHDELQVNVVELAEIYGWWHWHDQDSRRNRAGLPDLILIRPPRLLFVELKTEKDKLRPGQAEVIDKLLAVPGIEVFVWKPHHLLAGKIQGFLR